jgi:hypothetical protein
MKTIIKKISLFLIAITSVVALVGCFADLNEVYELEFVNLPQSTYYKVDGDAQTIMNAYETLLREITIKITTSKGTVTKNLDEAMKSSGDDKVTINFDPTILTSVGTKTIVITLGSAKLTYVFNVVEEAEIFAEGSGTEDDPYKITTPQQLINIGTRVFGIPVPQSTDETAWKYYYQFSFPYLTTGKYYELQNDLDFTGVTFRTIGSFGGLNYVPFTGQLDGNGYKIKNLTVQAFSDANSLFAGLSKATVKDLTFTNINIQASDYKYAGALYSMPGVTSSADYINFVENVNVESGLITAQRAGGLAGEANNTIFNSCTIGLSSGSVVIIGTNNHTGGIISGALSTRNYKYSETDHDNDGSDIFALNISHLQDLTESDNNEFIGIGRTGSKTISGTNTTSVIFFNCTVRAHVYGATNYGAYASMGDDGGFFFVYNSSGTPMANNDSSVVKAKLTNQLPSTEYSTVEYTLTAEMQKGTYSYQSIILSNPSFDSGTINLDSMEFKNYVYNIDGEVIETKLPEFKGGTGYKVYINAFYFNSNGQLIGIYAHELSSNTDYEIKISNNGRTLEYSKIIS